MEPFFSGRKVSRRDVSILHDLDIKCFPFPWEAKDWEKAADTFEVRLYRAEGTDVGLWCGRAPSVREEEENPSMKGCYELMKLCVREGYKVPIAPDRPKEFVTKLTRRLGYSRAMLPDIMRHARNWGKTHIRVTIPEYFLDPNFPDYIGTWLTKVGFKKTGVIDRAVLYRYLNWWDSYEYKMQVP